MSIEVKPNELRIGNWVYGRKDGKKQSYIRVTSIDDYGINREDESGYYGETYANYDGYFNDAWYDHAMIEPIQLTSELLIKCGFEKDIVSFWEYWTKKHTMVLVEWTFKISLDGDECRWIDGNTNVPIYYLHQLQNIWYALTYTELTIEL